MSKSTNSDKKIPRYPETVTAQSAIFLPSVAAIRAARPKYTAKQKAYLDAAFPVIDPGSAPIADRIIVQYRQPVQKGAIKINPQEIHARIYNEHVAKVIAIGATAFRNQDTGEAWPEGAWYEVGQYVHIPAMLPARWKIEAGDKQATFVMLRCYEANVLVDGTLLFSEMN